MVTSPRCLSELKKKTHPCANIFFANIGHLVIFYTKCKYWQEQFELVYHFRISFQVKHAVNLRLSSHLCQIWTISFEEKKCLELHVNLSFRVISVSVHLNKFSNCEIWLKVVRIVSSNVFLSEESDSPFFFTYCISHDLLRVMCNSLDPVAG